jgi:uncharacterized protein YijF (DUF1287 family)
MRCKLSLVIFVISFASILAAQSTALAQQSSLPQVSTTSSATSVASKLVIAAKERLSHTVTYDGSYLRIDYPNGDVPSGIGVCTDVIIRAYRRLNIDLQQLVHEDMKANFEQYPSKRIWGLSRPDTNIDHRRVPNMQAFFERNGQSLPLSTKKEDFLAGDIVTWMLPGNLPHIGIVVDEKSARTDNHRIVHNIGRGPKLDDILFSYEMTGHYRFDGLVVLE